MIAARLSLPTLCMAGLLASVTMPAMADEKPTKAQWTIKYRQATFTMLAWNIGPISSMVKGETPVDKARLALHAERLAQLSPMILEGFPADTKTGAPTDAKAEIWDNMADFRAKATALDEATAKLAKVAPGGDMKAIAAGLGEVGNACKSCHQKYRAD